MLSLKISNFMKEQTRSREYPKEEVIKNTYKKYGRVENPFTLGLWYDCCYASVCEELGIDRKNGEELKLKKRRVRLVSKGR